MVSLDVRWYGFDWDEGNRDKNLSLHGVTDDEAEQVFYGDPKVLRKSERLLAYGRTYAGRYLFVVFVLRQGLIRVISAREMTKGERNFYRRK